MSGPNKNLGFISLRNVEVIPDPTQPIKDEIDEVISAMTAQNTDDMKPESTKVNRKPTKTTKFQRIVVSKYGAIFKRRSVKTELSISTAAPKQQKLNWLCDKCGQQYSSKQNLAIHRCARRPRHMSSYRPRRRLVKPKPRNWYCELCAGRYISRQGFANHRCINRLKKRPPPQPRRQLNVKPRVMNCDQCSGRYFSKQGLLFHRCIRQFKTDPTVPRNDGTSKGVKPKMALRRCDRCSQQYKSKQGLLGHRCFQRFAIDGTPTKKVRNWKKDKRNGLFSCDSCSATLQSKQGLLTHRCLDFKNQLPPLDFDRNCDDCGMEFQMRQCLLRHITLIHLGIRPYWCGDCGTSFSQEVSYKHHRSSQHDDGAKNEVACDHCEQTFTKRDSMREHIFTKHTLQKSVHKMPFRCGICRMGFLHAYRLRKHTLATHAHIAGRSLHCNVCDAALRTKLGLVIHYDANHLESI